MVVCHRHNRRHANARLIHGDEEEANPFLFFCIRIGADKRENPIGMVRVGCPNLGAVNDICVANALRLGLERSQVRT